MQNPVVGSLIAQVQENKAKEIAYLKQLSKAPSIMDINIGKRLQVLKDFNEGRVNDRNNNDDNNDDEDGQGMPPTPPPPLPRVPRDVFPTPPYTPADDDDNDDANLTPTQRFLLRRPRTGGERVAEATGQELTRTTPQRVTFSDNITRVFPQGRKIMEKPDDIKELEEDASISEIRTAAKELNRGKEPQNLKFYSRDEKEGVELLAHARRRIGSLGEENEAVIEYLTTPSYGPQILAKNNIKIHIETGMFYVDNRTTGESLYNFLKIQDDTTKKLLRVKINIDGDLKYYFNEIFPVSIHHSPFPVLLFTSSLFYITYN